MTKEYITVPEATANPEIVRAMTRHLLDALEAFIRALPDDTVNYRDVLMGSHNFHVMAVLDLVERTGGETLWIDSALATFEMRMQGEKQKQKMEVGKGRKH